MFNLYKVCKLIFHPSQRKAEEVEPVRHTGVIQMSSFYQSVITGSGLVSSYTVLPESAQRRSAWRGVAVACCSAFALAGCDSGVDLARNAADSDSPVTASSPAGELAVASPQPDNVPSNDGLEARIAGFYDASVDFDAIGKDVAHIRVTEDGKFMEYDYQADSIDQGADCHTVNALSLTPHAQGFWIDDGARSASFSLRALPEGLEISFVDTADLDRDGDSEEMLRTVLQRVDDFDEADMNWCA